MAPPFFEKKNTTGYRANTQNNNGIMHKIKGKNQMGEKRLAGEG
jgi:hypothetical protein